ncbi:MAG: DUF1501 domain-containing protein [Acidobacteria bacterium]|nr:DUF1501 domain-containing protein [Acidobacteriota bacterium]MBI3471308.1 DUF1501 domain-containing protein [Candidatus Solibacter usitatus]
MTREQERFLQFVTRHPHDHTAFFKRPDWSRRHFFRMLGGAVTGSALMARPALAGESTVAANVTPLNKAKNVILITLDGAPSHIDTFDFKMVAGVTPDSLAPEKINGLDWPRGLLPKLATNLQNNDFAIVRSVRAWALVHSLARTWVQVGRNPAGALGDIAPNIGSVVAIEKDPERRTGQVFPTFLALNANQAAGSGYLPATFAPFKFTPAARGSTTGIPNTTTSAGSAGAEDRWNLLHTLDNPLRGVNNVSGSPLGRIAEDYEHFYQSAKGMMYNPVVDAAFRASTADAARYGNTGFGASCLVAKQVLAANQGTRFIQVSLGGWDMHNNIYAANQLSARAADLDNGLSALLGDLKSSGLIAETLIVMMGEFGRTVGRLSAAQGRDHFLQQFVMFAGAGVKGGRAIGATTADGSATAAPGWSRNRDVRPEDVEATIYSAMGINWTTVRRDDPTGRGFELVPFSGQDLYGPINELWA